MVKKALLVGCNYPGTEAQLRGCINDVMSMFDLLTRIKGFDRSNVKIMIDTDNRYERPTGRNMKRALTELITSAQPGDILVFHFSGHGTQIPAEGPDPEEDGKDEAICPTDLNIIVDDDLRMIVEKLPAGAELTVICDCCHSGGMLDHKQIQISDGPQQMSAGGSLFDMMNTVLGGRGIDPHSIQHTNKEIPLDLLASMLTKRTGTRVAPGNIRSSMANIFGGDASQVCLSMMNALMQSGAMGGARAQQGGGLMALIGCCMAMLSQQGQQHQQQQQQQQGGFQQPTSQGGAISYPPNFQQPQKPENRLGEDKGILVTGCESHQTSADACPSGDPSKAFGALTNAITTLVNQNPDIDYYSLVSQTRVYLGNGGFSQKPCLECSSENARKPFICASGQSTAHI